MEDIVDDIQEKQEVENKTEENALEQIKTNIIAEKLDNSVAEYYDNSLAKKGKQIQGLTEKLVEAEIDVKGKQIQGKKQIVKAEIETAVAQAKSVEDGEKHERAKTVLKAQGLTEKLPKPFRITALIVGYPFFVLYLLTLGWVIEFITFVIKGFITMIFDCAEKFVSLNEKFIEVNNNKNFSLGKALFGILKWVIVVGSIVAVIILISNK